MKKGITLRKLLKEQPPYIRNNAEGLIIKRAEKATTKKGYPAARFIVASASVSGKNYEITVVGKHSELKLSEKNQLVVVHCSCSFFWSYCEYALTQHAASTIKYCNGQPAVVNNPDNFPLICKHLYRCLTAIVEKQI